MAQVAFGSLKVGELEPSFDIKAFLAGDVGLSLFSMKFERLDCEFFSNSGPSSMSEDVSEQLNSCSSLSSWLSLIKLSNMLTIDSAAVMVLPSPTGSKFGSIRCREGITHN